ncbi:hypothetical protein [Cohaesibacter celericrescens]|uniref:Glycosaminoglycan attachment protein n=1 Tax=Cohaesibacter celericrescens TaxID=2067669 RepID=A0A2N5XVI6_9HYPH|nr:hypothetical protein [Cohaesibacter celericrescens]PLW78499.1 hypothetical protein C0081_04220 [Cohaesibacter celericrescens]
MKEISKIRFNAIAGYARTPRAALTGEELAYYEVEDGSILGLLIRDRTDGDFAGMAFGRDAKLRFRWTSMTDFLEDPELARNALAELMANLLEEPDEFHHQGDEKGEPVDFFTPVHPPEALHPDFHQIATEIGFFPARGIIEPMMRWHEDLDGNFVEQFQSTAFDQRIWELYLFATLIELGFSLDTAHAVPDFIGTSLFGSIAIEAVTAGPTRRGAEIVPPPPVETEEQMDAYLRDYMPIKFGSPLFSKLRKKYWEQKQIAGMPLVFAIADFSSPGSMIYTRSALERYLYGFSFDTVRDEQGKTVAKPVKIIEHRWEDKVVPSGFFDIQDSEHVSAVMSTAAGTISKFNRMGILAGFDAGDVLMTRTGTVVDPDPQATNPLLFKAIVNADGYHESWVEGLNVYHNPRAITPLEEYLIPGAAHHHCDEEGNWKTTAPRFHPLASNTKILGGVNVAQVLADFEGPAIQFWKKS